MGKNPSPTNDIVVDVPFNQSNHFKSNKELRKAPDMDSESTSESSGELQSDRFNIVKIASFLLGIGMLLPWNVFITATNYWDYKFRNISDYNVTTEVQVNFASYLAIAFNFPYIICMTFATMYSHRIRQFFAITICLLIILSVFAVVTTLVQVDSDNWQPYFLGMTLFQVVVISVSNGFVQTGVTGLLSLLPANYIYLSLNGQAIAGIFTSVLNVLILLQDATPLDSALVYFISAVVALVFAFVSYLAMHQTKFFNFHYQNWTRMCSESQALNQSSKVLQGRHEPSMLALIKMEWKYCGSMLLLFWVTIGVFPGIAAQVKSVSDTDSKWTRELFVPLVCFLTFNICDFLGRFLNTWLPIPAGKANRVLGLCGLRIVFIPLFMLCHLRKHHYLPSFFNHDYYFIVFMILFALSNGYLITTIFMLGPKSVAPEYQQKAGSLLVTCLGIGITIGAFSSFLFVKLI